MCSEAEEVVFISISAEDRIAIYDAVAGRLRHRTDVAVPGPAAMCLSPETTARNQPVEGPPTVYRSRSV